MTAVAARIVHATERHAADIPRLTHGEARVLAQTEYARLLAVLETLDGDDWTQPTYCTAWNVRDMTAHLAGACAAFTRWAEFKRQMLANPYLKETSQSVDGINKRQLQDRAAKTGVELVAEFRDVAPKAIHTRMRLPAPMRYLPIPFGPPLGTAPLKYLTETIYTRDQWMHRYDICAATGKIMHVTPPHDGRVVDLVIRDLALLLKQQPDATTITLVLAGKLEGAYRFGASAAADARVELDVFDFNLLASGRITYETAAQRALISGDGDAGLRFLRATNVPY